MTTDIPTSFIKNQSLTQTPTNGDATLVDDTTALVDDPAALSGGPVTIVEGLKVSATQLVPRPRIVIGR